MAHKNELKGLPRLAPDIQAFVASYEGFEKRFFENMRFYSNQEEAYEATERQYMHIMGRRKYADYNSFRNIRNRITNNRVKNDVTKTLKIKPKPKPKKRNATMLQKKCNNVT